VNPIEDGWDNNDWSRAYNAANSKIRAKKDNRLLALLELLEEHEWWLRRAEACS
jgi:hypothetical protein